MFEVAGVAIFALTGALVAARKGMDPFGFVLLATVTGVEMCIRDSCTAPRSPISIQPTIHRNRSASRWSPSAATGAAR